jgi:UDP-2,3-diacylglucosamine hydrolase
VSLRIAAGESALFASDVHLHAGQPDTAELFLDRVAAVAGDAAHLFLLGDLFEVWVGDDADNAYQDRLADVLSRLSAGGTKVWLMRGNRDFLMDVPVPAGGRPYSASCGATMLDDPVSVDLHGTCAVLTHGDALCTDDHAYQRWRATCRDPRWQQAFLARPLAERLELVRAVREVSESGKRQMAEHQMDVNQRAVDALMQSLGAQLMIHGHTHRPGCHRHDGRTRWVLPDWDAADGRGGLLSARDGKLSMIGSRNEPA